MGIVSYLGLSEYIWGPLTPYCDAQPTKIAAIQESATNHFLPAELVRTYCSSSTNCF